MIEERLAALRVALFEGDEQEQRETFAFLKEALDREAMLKAADLWAQARKNGLPTADPKALDGDAILAAQALEVNGIVATDNVGHLARFVTARTWRDIR
jgi:predicted nucleic acid-binding protein